MKPWKVILAAVVIFAAGVMVGTSFRPMAPRAVTPAVANPGQQPPLPRNFVVQRLEFLRQAELQLDLDDAQREKVARILEESRQQARQIMDKLTPEMRAEVRRTTAAIRETLGPDQRLKFDRIMRSRTQQQKQKADEKKKKAGSTNSQVFGQPGE